jgi:hypothetical protein
MTNAFTAPEPTPTGSPTTGLLTSVIVSALAPVFFSVTGGDIPLAHMAAEEIINEHRARNRVDLIAVGQIIANGLAALGSLGQSMNDEIPLPMALRLRANAISLNRTVEHNRRLRKQNQDAEPVDLGTATYAEPAPPEEPEPDQPEIFLKDDVAQFLEAKAASRLTTPAEQSAGPASDDPAPAEPTATPALEERRQRQTQAIAMIKEAGDISASLRTLPPPEREQAEFRAAMLGRSARELITGEQLPPLVQSGGEAAMNGSGNRSEIV